MWNEFISIISTFVSVTLSSKLADEDHEAFSMLSAILCNKHVTWMSYVVNAFACLVNIEIPGENMKDFVSNHTPVTGYKYQGDIFVWIQKGFCSCLEVIDLVAYKSGAEGCI